MGSSDELELWLKPVVRYRIDPPPVGWVADSDGWRTNIWEAGRKLWLTDQAIEVQGPGDRGFNYADPFWIDTPLTPQQTTMRTVRLPSKWKIHMRSYAFGPYLFPWPKVKFLALSSRLPDDAEVTVAVQCLGRLDRLWDALRNVGVRES